MVASSPPRLLGCDALLGANLLASSSCIVLRIDWAGEADADPASLFQDVEALKDHPRFLEAGLQPEPPPAVGKGADGLGALTAWLAGLLQHVVGHEPPLLERREGGAAALTFAFWDLDTGLRAGHSAFALMASWLRRPRGATEGSHEALGSYFRAIDRIALRPTAVRLIRAAQQRGIPWTRLLPELKVIQLGHGIRQRRILNSRTPATGHIASFLQQQKDVTARLLRASGLPAPRNRRVASAEEAVAAAQSLGYPVVVKPASAAYGYGVCLNNRTADEVRQAYATAAAHGKVLVEEPIPGEQHRLVVMQGRFLSAVRQEAPVVMGDGKASISELIARTNRQRLQDRESAPVPLRLDAAMRALLRRADLAPESVPAAGQRVQLRQGSNLSGGGTAQNVTALVHPEVRHLAERATAIIGLDIAGIDFITPDISRPYSEVGGSICEINAGPDLSMREPDNLVENTFLAGLFGAGEDGRIPIVCLLASGRQTTELAGAIAATAWQGRQPGLAVVSERGLHLGGRRLVAGDREFDELVRIALAEPTASALLLLVSPPALEKHGLGIERCALAILPDAKGEPGEEAAGRLLGAVADRTLALADAGAARLAALAALGA